MTGYVSTAGRAFFRTNRTSTGGRNRGGNRGASVSVDRAPGEAVSGITAGRTSFQGSRMTIISGYQSGARQIVVDFAPDFATCSAQVVLGREGGQN